jgi:hypothetical protein
MHGGHGDDWSITSLNAMNVSAIDDVLTHWMHLLRF